MTTHYMEEATNCSRLAFMYDGRVIADGSPSEIRQRHAVDGVTPSLEDVFVELVSGRRGP